MHWTKREWLESRVNTAKEELKEALIPALGQEHTDEVLLKLDNLIDVKIEVENEYRAFRESDDD